MARIIIVLMFLTIIYNLAVGFRHIVMEKDSGTTGVRALTRRILLSFVLIGLIMLAVGMGWIQPHGVIPQTAG